MLLFVATLIFVAGRPRYRCVPPVGSVVTRALGAISLALWRTAKTYLPTANRHTDSHRAPVAHWLERARPRYSAVLVGELRLALRAVAVFVPIVFFWSLFDQHASRWVFQATRMKRNVFGYELEPDQMPFVNPFLVLVLIPTMVINFLFSFL